MTKKIIRVISLCCMITLTASTFVSQSYIVVVQAFKNESLAHMYQQELKQIGYDSQIYFNSERGFYYVYFEEFKNQTTANKEKESLRAAGFVNAWVYEKKG